MSVITAYDCLKYAIGLSRNECECFDTDRPIDANTSDSDLFLDEVEGLELKVVDDLNDCSSGSLWNLMAWARQEAIYTVIAELTAAIQMRTKPRRDMFKGLIGEESYKNTRQMTTAMAGSSLLMAPVRGGTMMIRAIGTIFNAVDAFNVGIYGKDGLIQAVPVTTLANKVTWTELVDHIELPMRDRRTRYHRYDFVYQVDGSSSPKDNTVNCGCGGTSSYNRMRPLWESTKDPWSEWVLAAGIEGNDIDDRENWKYSKYANGIILDVYFKCDSSLIVCDERMDYNSDPMAHVLAHTFRFKAAELLIGKILSSPDISVYTMSNREQYAANKEFFIEKSNSRIAYLAQEMSRNEFLNRNSDCLTCKTVMSIGNVRL